MCRFVAAIAFALSASIAWAAPGVNPNPQPDPVSEQSTGSLAMFAYAQCWRKAAKTKSLAHTADVACGPESDVAARLNGLEAVKDMRRNLVLDIGKQY